MICFWYRLKSDETSWFLESDKHGRAEESLAILQIPVKSISMRPKKTSIDILITFSFYLILYKFCYSWSSQFFSKKYHGFIKVTWWEKILKSNRSTKLEHSEEFLKMHLETVTLLMERIVPSTENINRYKLRATKLVEKRQQVSFWADLQQCSTKMAIYDRNIPLDQREI